MEDKDKGLWLGRKGDPRLPSRAPTYSGLETQQGRHHDPSPGCSPPCGGAGGGGVA